MTNKSIQVDPGSHYLHTESGKKVLKLMDSTFIHKSTNRCVKGALIKIAIRDQQPFNLPHGLSVILN